MKRKVVATLLILVLFCISTGCMVLQRKSVTESYRVSGELLETTRVVMRTLCDNGTFTPEKCIELRLRYERAAASFLKAGDALKQANRANQVVDDILVGIQNDIRRIE